MADSPNNTTLSRRLFAASAPIAALAALTLRSEAMPIPSALSGCAAELYAVWAELDVCVDDEVDEVMDRSYPILERMITTPAADLGDLKMKADAVRWLYADVKGQLDHDFDGTPDLRLLGSLLRDLLAA